MILDAMRNTAPSSLRNYAKVLLMARLGLCPPEVVAMQLDDISWRSGEFLVRGKGDRHDRLPLLPEVGKALADYIKLERVTTSRLLFVTSRPGEASDMCRKNVLRADFHSILRGQIRPCDALSVAPPDDNDMKSIRR